MRTSILWMDTKTKDISDMAKNKPSIRQSWHAYKEKQAKYNEMIGKENKKDFSSLKALKN